MNTTSNVSTHRVAGRQVTCSHCGGTHSAARSILLNTRGATFFNFDWLNKGATVLTCTQCGRLEWFDAQLR